MKSSEIEFKFKGNRDYIQGPDLFNAILSTAQRHHVPTEIRFVIHGFVRNPLCQLYLLETKDELSRLEALLVHCQYRSGGTLHWLALKEADAKGIFAGRLDYDEEQIVALCRREGEAISLAGRSGFSFIETVVAMTKELHQQLFPTSEGKWIFSRIDLGQVVENREGLVVHLRHNMNQRLTKNEVLVNGIKVGDLYFSLVKS